MRLRPGDLPVKLLPNTTTPNEEKATRLRAAKLPLKALPKAISALDGKAVRMRAIDLPVVGSDAGGLSVAFFVVAFALGIDQWKNVYAVLSAVGFAVFPTWAGLMATVALAPHGEERMFPLNAATVVVTLVGHLIFGLVLGLAFLKAPRGKDRSGWPWPPLSESAPAKRAIRFAKKVTSSP